MLAKEGKRKRYVGMCVEIKPFKVLCVWCYKLFEQLMNRVFGEISRQILVGTL